MIENTIKTADRCFMNTYARFQIVMEKGSGCALWDTEGRRYLDFMAGIAVCNLGHSEPEVVNAVKSQAEKLFHTSNLYYTEPQTELASMLVEKSFADRVFFANSGAEANEAAIKLARKFFSDRGENERFKIITATGSFHGRTMAALSATGQEKIKKGFSPVLEGFDHIPFNDLEALKAKIDESVCAVMLEPLLGEGGVVAPEPGWLKAVRKLCDDTGVLMILDEIQTGMGRCGALFCHELFGVSPDIMTLAKGLANGLPMGAALAGESIASAFTPGTHGTTFGGNPVAAAAAVAVMKLLDDGGIIKNCRENGEYFKAGLTDLKERYGFIREVRGMGLLLGMELDFAGAEIVNKCLERGFLINCVQDRVLRFLPPLIVKREEIDLLMEALKDVFE